MLRLGFFGTGFGREKVSSARVPEMALSGFHGCWAVEFEVEENSATSARGSRVW